jgi:hypothetical protein
MLKTSEISMPQKYGSYLSHPVSAYRLSLSFICIVDENGKYF